MKYNLSIFTCLYVTIVFSISSVLTSLSSYLKIDIVEAVNMHCKLNNEFYCNPYAEITFKYFTETKTSKSVECTKHPKWDSTFIFTPGTCRDIVYINLYQYLTPRDTAYLDIATNEGEDSEKGEYKPGYLGRVILELEKIPHGMIDDWFMVDTPSENVRIVFPTCVHLRISWTSADCTLPGDSFKYQIQPSSQEEFMPRNYIPMCKKDFALVYKTKFSRLETIDQIRNKKEIAATTAKDISSLCKVDLNTDFGFLHTYSNLTSIEEALVYKIIKRTTGENINYEEFTSEYTDPNKHKKYVKSYKEFFSKECFKKIDMTIERVNSILKNDAASFPQNTTNYFLTPELEKLNYSDKTNLFHLENVYKDTLSQFYAVEDIKNLSTMDDDSYIQTLNKLSKVIKGIHAEKKIDETIFTVKNKVLFTNEGLINPKEELFFRIYALYKWNGGQYPYDEIKREFILRRKYFDCYERVDMMPTNILFQFIDDVCPNNYVCLDPNGIVFNSVGRNPNEVFAKEIKETKLKFLEKSNNFNRKFRVAVNNKNNINNLRFRQNGSNSNGITISTSGELNNTDSYLKDPSTINFEDLLKLEITLPAENPDSLELSEPAKVVSFVKNDDNSNQIKINPYTTKNTYKNKFDLMYETRLIRIKQKKEVIIYKVFNHIPLLGEILSIANLAVDTNKTNSYKDHFDEKFLTREKDLLKKYLLLYDSNIPFVEQAAKVLLDLILCNNDKTSIAHTLRELLEGLCYGDDRSIKIFEEIVRTVLIESLLLKPYFLFADLHAKANLLNTLNKPFCYKAITKIRFLESMLMYDYLKEKITYIIYENDTNIKIAIRIKQTEDSIRNTLPKNKREFSLAGYQFDNIDTVNKNYMAEMDRIKLDFEDRTKREKYEKDNNINSGKLRFKSVRSDYKTYDDANDDDILDRIKTIRNILDSEIKNENYAGRNLNMKKDRVKTIPSLKNSNLIIGNKVKSNRMNSDIPLSNLKEDDLFDEFKDFIDEKKKEYYVKDDDKDKNKVEINNEEMLKINNTKREEDYSQGVSSPEYNKTKNENLISSHNKNLYNKSIDTFPKFKSISSKKETTTQYSSEDNDEFAKQSLNQYNNPNNYNNPDDKSYSILSTNKQPSSEEILNKVMEDNNSKTLIENIKSNPNGKIILPKEIHTIYEVGKQGTKQVTVNANHPTKKLILDKLMDENSYNDLMNQDEKKEENNEQTGLFNVLKNIQNRKCSFDFLCIEIGTIYGPFDDLKPKEVTIMTKHKENVHVIIKPIIMINNTVTNKEKDDTKPQKDLFDNDEDCDILKISNEKNKNSYSANMIFKQIVDRDVKQTKLKRKFYRKVEMGNEILATEIFKQGLNMIILKREKNYPKIFERTYNTNSDPIESDAMACVLRDSGYDKIIVITGIGKWMGSITPRLVKEIKQIGGPNLNYLVTADGDDNSMADHAFILIGRRGLCRYNGVFRLKNYDVSADMKKYFTDLSSDPNDCYFDDISFENEKNKNNENKFFHLIDLRLTLDLSNDSRFSSKAPVITNSFPNSGPINGGQIVKIRGFNFGTKSLDIKEILIRGVICKNVVFESAFLITCVTGSSTIMGPGVGNIQVKLLCGLSSPLATCNMYQYTSDIKLQEATVEIVPQEAAPQNNFNINDDAVISEGVTVINRPYLPPPTHFIPMVHPLPMPINALYPIPHPMHLPYPIPEPGIPLHHPFSNSLFANQHDLFSFKEKQPENEEKDDITKSILVRLNSKDHFNTDNKNQNVQKIDNLVSDNYKQILSNINSSSFNTPRDGFRKRRFTNIFEKLK